MDALSATHPVSSLRQKPFLSTNTNPPLHLLKPPQPSNASFPPFPTNLSAKPGSIPLAPKPLPNVQALPLPPKRHPAAVRFTGQTHSKAATGYAAALLDVAACDGVLGAVAEDVRRFMRAVHVVLEDEAAEEALKGEVVKRVVEGGKFYAKLVVLVRMLVRKGKVAVVGEVMEEFGRLWVELCGSKRVLMVK